MKKLIVYRIFIVLGIVLLTSFLIWAFIQHGTAGVFHTDATVRTGLIIFILCGVLLLGLALWQFILRNRPASATSRRLTVPIIIFTIICILVPGSGFVYLNTNFSPPLADTAPQLMLTDSNGINGVPNMAIVRYTGTPMRDFLMWGTGDTANSLFDNKPELQHVYILSDLIPDTEYYYQVNLGTTYYFKTPSTDEESLHFAAAGDAHFGAGNNRPDLTSKMLSEIADPSNNFDAFFSLGDLVNYGFADSQWQEAISQLASISRISSAFVAGNHDALLTGLKRYEYYCSPELVDSASGSRLWYRVDIGKIHLLILDLEFSAESYTPAQAAWLTRQLQDIPDGDWKIVLSHGYYYASGTPENGWPWRDNPETIAPLVPLFEKYGVNLVFSGHDHQLELLQKSGVTYVISGGFGGLLDKARTYTSPYSVWYAASKYGFADVTIKGNEANIVFRDTDFGVLESFTINK